MNLDFRTVYFFGALMNIAFLGLSAFTWFRSPSENNGESDAVQYWFSGFACFVAGMTMIALRGTIPDAISIFAANSLLLFGVLLKGIGLFRFLGLRPRSVERGMLAAFASTVIALFCVQYVVPSMIARMFTISLGFTVLGSINVYFLTFRSGPELKKIVRPALFIYSAFTALYAIRMVLSLNWTGGPSYIDSANIPEEAILICLLFLMSALAVTEMLLLHDKVVLSLNKTADELGVHNAMLREEVERRIRAETELMAINREMGSTQQEIMITLSEVVEFRSRETALHVARVAEYTRALCAVHNLSDEDTQLIGDASPMHDIGKIAVPDSVLNKPAGLDAEELQLIQSHTKVGYNLLNKSERPLIRMAALIAFEHHERWNGEGYPCGKKGEEISLAGRIVCLCDVFDALSVARPYKQAWELPRILEYLREQRGIMFDPSLVDAFFLNLDVFLKISKRLKD